MEAFLTQEEVIFLTGQKQRARQVKALKKRGIPHWVNDKGVPVVPRSFVDGKRKAQNPEPFDFDRVT